MSVKNADLRHLGIMGKLQKPSASALKLYTITRPAGQIACVDAAETHISTLKNVKRTASKTASKKVQVEFEDSSDEVHGCFERVPALWCPDRKAKTVRFRPSTSVVINSQQASRRSKLTSLANGFGIKSNEFDNAF